MAPWAIILVLIAFFLLWVTMVAFGALIFSAKNREPGWGALLGGTLGLAGLIIAAFFSRLPPTSQER